MTTEKLQAILKGPKKLTLNEIKEILYNLQNDCFDQVYKLHDFPNIVREEKDGVTSFKAVMKRVGEEQFYMGEANAFYICLDLLDKLEVNHGRKEIN